MLQNIPPSGSMVIWSNHILASSITLNASQIGKGIMFQFLLPTLVNANHVLKGLWIDIFDKFVVKWFRWIAPVVSRVTIFALKQGRRFWVSARYTCLPLQYTSDMCRSAENFDLPWLPIVKERDCESAQRQLLIIATCSRENEYAAAPKYVEHTAFYYTGRGLVKTDTWHSENVGWAANSAHCEKRCCFSMQTKDCPDQHPLFFKRN